MAKLSVELQKYFLSDVPESGIEPSRAEISDVGIAEPSDAILQESGFANASEESFSSQMRSPIHRSSQVNLDEILEIAGERTFGFLFVLLSLPSALPIPAPGYSTPFGIVMFLLAVQLIAGRDQPWVPEKFRKKGFERENVQELISKGIPWLQKIELVARPRLTPVCTSRIGQTVIGIAIALMSISMMIPIPLTNTLPAIGIFVTGFGLLDDDGAISLAGMTICAISFTTTSAILYLLLVKGPEIMLDSVERAKDWIKP